MALACATVTWDIRGMMEYRDDPDWQAAQSRYITGFPGVTANEKFDVRVRAAQEMRDIEEGISRV